MKFYLMCGIPGSGKSTARKKIELKNPGITVICPDDIRKELTGDASDQSKNSEVFVEAYKRLDKACEEEKNVIFDATNVTQRSREEVLRHIPEQYKKIAVFMTTSYETCLERNASRDRQIPESVIRNMYNKQTRPSKKEGFNEIWLIK